MTRNEKERASDLWRQLSAIREHVREFGANGYAVGECVDLLEESVQEMDQGKAEEAALAAYQYYGELEHHQKEAMHYCDAALGTIAELTGLHVAPSSAFDVIEGW